jgi:hypothetical protein
MATGPDYDAWTEGEGEWVDNGEKADAPTRAALVIEIDAWFEENWPDMCGAIAERFRQTWKETSNVHQ